MVVFRLARERFSYTLSGMGAARYGARWNSAGVELVYTAGNRSLAMAEVAVHLSVATLPDDYMMLSVHIPDSLSVDELRTDQLPDNWNAFPYPLTTKKIGDTFVSDNRAAILRIPSVVTQGDFNYLLNPKHPDFTKISILSRERFPFDRRIFSS